MSSSTDKSDKTALDNTREVLICNYSNSIVSEKKAILKTMKKTLKSLKTIY
jgi:hypothetical protein